MVSLLLAVVVNLVGALAGTAVAKTIASGFADPALVTQSVVLAALIGGLAGSVVAQAGFGAFQWGTLVDKVLVPLVLSPCIGFLVAFFLMIGLTWMATMLRPPTVQRGARKLQLVSASLMAFSHGSNDAQKSMGIITLALVAFAAAGHDLPAALPDWVMPAEPSSVPYWVILVCAGAIAFGTAFGGVRIIKTMGTKIIRISPLQGFAAETSGAATILAASHFGIPVSTTHCINACIMGVGASKRLSAVRWGVATNIVVAWVVTLPAAAAMSWGAMLVLGAATG